MDLIHGAPRILSSASLSAQHSFTCFLCLPLSTEHSTGPAHRGLPPAATTPTTDKEGFPNHPKLALASRCLLCVPLLSFFLPAVYSRAGTAWLLPGWGHSLR